MFVIIDIQSVNEIVHACSDQSIPLLSKARLDTFVHRFLAYFDFMTYVQCGTSYSCALL